MDPKQILPITREALEKLEVEIQSLRARNVRLEAILGEVFESGVHEALCPARNMITDTQWKVCDCFRIKLKAALDGDKP